MDSCTVKYQTYKKAWPSLRPYPKVLDGLNCSRKLQLNKDINREGDHWGGVEKAQIQTVGLSRQSQRKQMWLFITG